MLSGHLKTVGISALFLITGAIIINVVFKKKGKKDAKKDNTSNSEEMEQEIPVIEF
jgi:hypothetical protein